MNKIMTLEEANEAINNLQHLTDGKKEALKEMHKAGIIGVRRVDMELGEEPNDVKIWLTEKGQKLIKGGIDDA